MTGGPSAFNGIGNKLKKGITPNDYDGQLFLYDLISKNPVQLSKNFSPSINSVYWKEKNIVYLNVTEKSFKRVYRFNLKKKKYKRINTITDVVSSMDISGNLAVYSGSSTSKAPMLYRLNLSSRTVSVLKNYNKEMFKNVLFGKCKDWDFKASSGKLIKGRLYYPIGFNKRKKYPCIVYYYGGTSPVTREYGGRYPKNWYAANGYIVYVLQPTGAVGFGQEASAVHVNDWGRITSKEIIDGIKQLVKEHQYIDSNKIGSMGASYGGFLTQYLATQTDIISAFISHAGISALSSYWGVGDWGYLYSGVASADSFPWNRKDLYVGHSPLYMVDRIKSPILLLHGDIDNNVPPGESYQMYAALKLAGKKAALITFKGQQHFILEYGKRVRWMRTIIAWFDKWLKNQPEHWNDMYGN
jgi:dipeptidyl aminopeptidase/acylaminoacyl peptidase